MTYYDSNWSQAQTDHYNQLTKEKSIMENIASSLQEEGIDATVIKKIKMPER